MLQRKVKGFGILALAVLTSAALGFANAPSSQNSPPPGTLNYVEGQVQVGGQQQTPKSVGSTYVGPDQGLQTANGNAEMLLTPGVYLRLGHDSAVTMISPDLASTQVELTKGSALLEVDELFKENDLSMVLDSSRTQVEKQGLYAFSAQPGSVKVLEGKAVVYQNDRHINLKKGHEALVAENQSLSQRKFDKDAFENDPLYRWSKLRSEYATEANVDVGNSLVAAGGWWGPGWYWDPFWADFAFMPGFGMMWGPFGFPFFSPWAVGYAPYYGFYGYRGGFAGSYYHYPVARGAMRPLPPLARTPVRGSAGFHSLPRSLAGGGMRAPAGGFAGGPRSFRGAMGGFRGDVGGFHGGFGGFHGGAFGGHR